MRLREGEGKEKGESSDSHKNPVPGMGKIFKDFNTDITGIKAVKKTTAERDRVRWGCSLEGAQDRDVGARVAHLIPWAMEVLLEIPGSSGTVLLYHGKQRPRAAGRESATGWEGQELCLESL